VADIDFGNRVQAKVGFLQCQPNRILVKFMWMFDRVLLKGKFYSFKEKLISRIHLSLTTAM
jgi:hypothetical protein